MNITAHFSLVALAEALNYKFLVSLPKCCYHLVVLLIADFKNNLPASSLATNVSNTHRVPPNVRFEIDDVEAGWTYNHKFDYIHCRFMGNAIRNWHQLVDQCFE